MEDSGIQVMMALIKILSLIVGWGFFLASLAMLKKFFSHGVSVAFAEFMLRNNDQKAIERVARWFGQSELILEYLSEINKKVSAENAEKNE